MADILPLVVADHSLGDGHHLILADEDAPYQLWLRGSLGVGALADRALAYLIVRDDATALRRLVADRLDALLSGAPTARSLKPLLPTAFQQHRLSLLLAILDLVLGGARGGAPPATTREVAASLVYPRASLPTGAAWKSSSERRQTQRLVDEALAMMRGGYRTLLRGRTAVRQ